MAKRKKPIRHHDCTVMRRILIRHGTLSLVTGETTMTHEEWVTKPCGVPLFGDELQRTGVCRSCASGWTHEHNYKV